MTLEEITKTIADVEGKVDNIKGMIADYNACKNERSKQYLLAAISKLTDSLKVATIHPRAA